MSKVNKLFLILGVILFSIMLTSCYKEEKFTFKEGKYEYTGEEFNFYNDVKINNISISFSLEDDIENNNNILVNRKNNLSYYVEIYISNQNNEKIQCSFTALQKVGDQVDRYYIELDISNLINTENAKLRMVLEIENSEYHYSEDKTNCIEANEIYLTIKNFTINENPITEYSFPSRLLLKYNMEE